MGLDSSKHRHRKVRGRAHHCVTASLPIQLCVAAVLALAALPRWQTCEAASRQGRWVTQNELDKLVKESGFRVAVVLYADGTGETQDSEVQNAFEASLHDLSNFVVSSYKVNCQQSPNAATCMEHYGELPRVQIYHGKDQTHLEPRQSSDSAAIISYSLQYLLTQFKMGSGHKLSVVSSRAELDRIKYRHSNIVLLASQELFGQAHRNFLEASYYFMNSRHGYRLKIVVTNNKELYEGSIKHATGAKSLVWGLHYKGEGHPDFISDFYGRIQPQNLLSFLFGYSLPSLLTGADFDDEKMIDELNVHGDFGLMLVFLPCGKLQFTTALRLIFTDANEKFRGSIAGVYIDVRKDKTLIAKIPEVQQLIKAATADESLRVPLVILRPPPKDGEAVNPVAVFNLTLENLETAYLDILYNPEAVRRLQQEDVTDTAKPATAARSKTKKTTKKNKKKEKKKEEEDGKTPTAKSSKEHTAKAKGKKTKKAEKQESRAAPSPSQSATEEEKRQARTVPRTPREPMEVQTGIYRTDGDELDQDLQMWNGDEPGTTVVVGEDDETALLSERTNRLEQLLSLSPMSFVPGVRREQVPELYQLAPLVVILYHLPYASPSRVFRVVFSDLAKEFKGQEQKVAFRTVDCGQLLEVCDRNGVRHYPTVGFLTQTKGTKRESKHTLYKDYLDFTTLFKSIQLRLQPVVKQISSRDDLVALIKKHYGFHGEKVAVALFNPGHLTEYSTFSTVADQWHSHLSFVSAHGKLLHHLLEKHGAEPPSVLLIKPRDIAEPFGLMKGKITAKNLKKFIKAASFYKMTPLSPSNLGQIHDEGKTIAIYIGPIGDIGERPEVTEASRTQAPPYSLKLLSTVKAVSKESTFLRQFAFLWLRENAPGVSDIKRALYLSDEEGHFLLVARKSESIFEFQGAPNKRSLREFLQGYLDGEAIPSGHLAGYQWLPTGRATDFLSRARHRSEWTGHPDKSGLSNVTIDDGTTQHSRIRVSAVRDEELMEGDEIEDFPGGSVRQSNGGRLQSRSEGASADLDHKHSEL